MTTVFLDFETRSEADLRKVGAWSYSEHPSTEVICACWAVDDGPIRDWVNYFLGEPGNESELDCLPFDFEDTLNDQSVLIEAHNVAFELAIWENVCVKRYGWPKIRLDRWRDTMAVANYYAMPPALDKLARALGLEGKDPAGERLITKYCKLHLKTARTEIPEEDLDAFLRYCAKDVELERQCANLLGELPPEELAIFRQDLRTNYRGIGIDKAGVADARALVEDHGVELAHEFEEITGLKPTQVVKFKGWLAEAGLEELPDLSKDTLEELLDEGRIGDEPAPELDEDVRRALELRREHARASTKKLDAMLRHRGRDGRARFQTRYHGAVTGRNTGLGIQPLNLTRGFDDVDPEQLVRDVRRGDAAWLAATYGDPLEVVGKASRHWLQAAEGSRIIAGDFSSIEAVVLAELAGEDWKRDVFRRGGPVYELMACKIHDLGAEAEALAWEDKAAFKKQYPQERQDGKHGELAFGYQGALGAWRKFDRSQRHDDSTVLGFVRGWRENNPAIVSFWSAMEDACYEAVARPGSICGVSRPGDTHLFISFERVDGWLTMILPDGKRLWYWAPEIRMLWPQWHQPSEFEECATGECGHKRRPQVTYMAQKEGRWKRVSTYSGKLTENAVQAVTRQILKAAEARVAAAWDPYLRATNYLSRDETCIILSVYDEVVCEVPEGFGSQDELKKLLEVPAGSWCGGWPIRASVWQGRRYRK